MLRKGLYFAGAIIVTAALIEAVYAFFFISQQMPWFAGRIGAFGWRMGQIVFGEEAGHIGYGLISVVFALTIAGSIYSDAKMQKIKKAGL